MMAVEKNQIERQILFSAPMVRAILEGRKTQTRRILRPQPLFVADPHVPFKTNDADPKEIISCPFGQPGDILWVRETWRIGAWDCVTSGLAIDYRADDSARREWINPFDDSDLTFQRYWDQCIDDCDKSGLKPSKDGGYHWSPGESPCRWRPSIHMPRWACRILLEIVSVRVERLNDISEEDAHAEGCEIQCMRPDGTDNGTAIYNPGGFIALWESINGHGSWAANPRVWVIEFRRVQP